jgi:hypothetical protein
VPPRMSAKATNHFHNHTILHEGMMWSIFMVLGCRVYVRSSCLSRLPLLVWLGLGTATHKFVATSEPSTLTHYQRDTQYSRLGVSAWLCNRQSACRLVSLQTKSGLSWFSGGELLPKPTNVESRNSSAINHNSNTVCFL